MSSKTVEIPASLFAEIRNFVASTRNIVQRDMSFTAIADKSEQLVKKMDLAKHHRFIPGTDTVHDRCSCGTILLSDSGVTVKQSWEGHLHDEGLA